MDVGRFDQIARSVARAISRRTGIRAALGAGVALLAGGMAADARGPAPSGPCKRTKRTDNTCKRNNECCTGICERAVRNKDGLGRCRCRKRGQACTADKNCCSRRGQEMACIEGICDVPVTCVPLQSTCAETDTCCAGVCGLQPTNLRIPVGTVCCIPQGLSGCSADEDCCVRFRGVCANNVCQGDD
jgi:hypothetical protein